MTPRFNSATKNLNGHLGTEAAVGVHDEWKTAIAPDSSKPDSPASTL